METCGLDIEMSDVFYVVCDTTDGEGFSVNVTDPVTYDAETSTFVIKKAVFTEAKAEADFAGIVYVNYEYSVGTVDVNGKIIIEGVTDDPMSFLMGAAMSFFM